MRTWIIETEQQRDRLAAFIARMSVVPVQAVTIAEYVPKRTSPQNARHWALLGEAAKHIGCSADDLHEDLLCQHYGFDEIHLPSGRIVRKPLKRSSARNVKEFGIFMEFCEAYLATELGVWA
jgi:hypothetical protein